MADATNDRFELLLREAIKRLARFQGEAAEGCPDEVALAAYIEGRLGGGDLERVQDHLSRCSRCLDIVLAAVRAETAVAVEGETGVTGNHLGKDIKICADTPFEQERSAIPGSLRDRLESAVLDALRQRRRQARVHQLLAGLWQSLSSLMSFRMVLSAAVAVGIVLAWMIPGLYRDLTWRSQVDITTVIWRGPESQERGGGVLAAERVIASPGEEVSLRLVVDRSCAVYAFIKDAKRNVRILYPTTTKESPPTLSPHEWERIGPPIAVDRNMLGGTIVILAVPDRIPDLDRIVKVISSSDDPAHSLRRKMGKRLLGIKVIRIIPPSGAG